MKNICLFHEINRNAPWEGKVFTVTALTRAVLEKSAFAHILHVGKGEKRHTLRHQTWGVTMHLVMSQATNSVHAVHTTLQTPFLNVFNLAGVFQKLFTGR